MYKTLEEMQDDKTICEYCETTDYGKRKYYNTPNGYYMCEGEWCKYAYESYLDGNDITENIVKYQNKVKLVNKENTYGV